MCPMFRGVGGAAFVHHTEPCCTDTSGVRQTSMSKREAEPEDEKQDTQRQRNNPAPLAENGRRFKEYDRGAIATQLFASHAGIDAHGAPSVLAEYASPDPDYVFEGLDATVAFTMCTNEVGRPVVRVEFHDPSPAEGMPITATLVCAYQHFPDSAFLVLSAVDEYADGVDVQVGTVRVSDSGVRVESIWAPLGSAPVAASAPIGQSPMEIVQRLVRDLPRLYDHPLWSRGERRVTFFDHDLGVHPSDGWLADIPDSKVELSVHPLSGAIAFEAKELGHGRWFNQNSAITVGDTSILFSDGQDVCEIDFTETNATVSLFAYRARQRWPIAIGPLCCVVVVDGMYRDLLLSVARQMRTRASGQDIAPHFALS